MIPPIKNNAVSIYFYLLDNFIFNINWNTVEEDHSRAKQRSWCPFNSYDFLQLISVYRNKQSTKYQPYERIGNFHKMFQWESTDELIDELIYRSYESFSFIYWKKINTWVS